MTETLSGFPYVGAKKANAGFHSNTVGAWINGLIPWEYRSMYIEPYAGMLGVLLQRNPVYRELVNDLNGDLVNWWICVRDHGKELADKLYSTPHSREIHRQALKDIEEKNLDGVDRAVAYSILLLSGTLDPVCWAAAYQTDVVKGGHTWRRRARRNKILALEERMRDVTIENRCALKIIDRARKVRRAILYLDPPYPNTADKYRMSHDYSDMIDLITRPDNTAKIALSGIDSDLELEGWTKHTYNRTISLNRSIMHKKDIQTQIVEVLYTNYKTNTTPSLFD